GEVTGSPPGFNEGELWIARHAADQDTLVFDPAESDPRADRISFYSLTQHRTRTFPRSVVLAQLEGIADDVGVRRAMRDYEDRAAGQQEHAEAMAAEQVLRIEDRRRDVLAAHRRYLEGMESGYPGVTPTPAAHRPGRRSKCHLCGIGLDDFAGSVCLGCNGVLCSCGACACMP